MRRLLEDRDSAQKEIINRRRNEKFRNSDVQQFLEINYSGQLKLEN